MEYIVREVIVPEGRKHLRLELDDVHLATFTPDAANGGALGTAALEFSDIYLASGAVIYGEDDQTNSITSSATGWQFALNATALGVIHAGADDDRQLEIRTYTDDPPALAEQLQGHFSRPDPLHVTSSSI